MANPRYEDTSPIPEHKDTSVPKYEDTSSLEPSIMEQGLSLAKKAARYLPPVAAFNTITNQEPTNVVEAGMRGLMQGASQGFSDEAQGAVSGLANVVSGGDYLPAYTEERDKARAFNAQANKMSPLVNEASELAGGAILPIGLTGNIYKATKSLPFLQRLAARVLPLAAEGAFQGGLAGAGYSEGETPEAVAKDSGKGALVGGGIGALVPGAATTVGGTLDLTGSIIKRLGNRFQPVGNIVKPIVKGLEGTDLSTDAQLKSLKDVSQDFGTTLASKVKEVHDDYTRLLNNFDANGGTVNLLEAAQAIEEKANALLKVTLDPETAKEINAVRDKVRNYAKLAKTEQVNTTKMVPDALPNDTSGGLLPPPEQTYSPVTTTSTVTTPAQTVVSPLQAKQLQSELGDITPLGGSPLKTSSAGNFAVESKKIVSKVVDAIPELAETNDNYRKLNQAASELGMDLNNIKVEDFGNGEQLATDVFNKVSALIENSGKDNRGSLIAHDKLDKIFAALDQIDPSISAKFRQRLETAAENLQLSKDIKNPNFSVGGIAKGIGSIGNAVGLGINKFAPSIDKITTGSGAAQSSIIEKFSKPQEVSEQAYQMSNSDLSNLSTQLMSTPALQSDGAALQKALSNNNAVSRNAAIFNLLQKKEGRDALRSMVK